MTDRYILGPGRIPIPEPDIYQWGMWFETHDRRIAYTELATGIRISTVFLGLDHAMLGGPPQLFETMVFGHDDYDEDEMYRYSTADEAERGHAAVLERWQRIIAEAMRKLNQICD